MVAIEPKDTKEIVLEAAHNDEEKLKLLGMAEVSLWLDNYDDIFSDFDPRPYSHRALSDDFLAEAKKAVRDKATGIIELQFLIPADKRNRFHEATIRKRLRDHFHKHHHIIQKETKGVIKRGAMLTSIGIALMLIATLITFHFKVSESIALTFFTILLEPGGWFLFWSGMDLMLFEWRKLKPELEFYEKMAKCNITFVPY